jgi:hypothetical protein
MQTKGNKGFGLLWGKIAPYIGGLKDIKNTSLLSLFGFLLVQVGYETCIHENLTKMQAIDKTLESLEQRRLSSEHKKSLFQDLSKELSSWATLVPEAEANQPKTLVAVNSSQRLLRLAKGEERLSQLPHALPTGKLHDVKLETVATSKDTTVAEFLGLKKPEGEQPPPPPPPPPPKEGEAKPDPSKPTGPEEAPPPEITASSIRKLDENSTPLTEFDYTFSAIGSYVAAVDFINQLALSPTLWSINSIKLEPATKNPGEISLTLGMSLLVGSKRQP